MISFCIVLHVFQWNKQEPREHVACPLQMILENCSHAIAVVRAIFSVGYVRRIKGCCNCRRLDQSVSQILGLKTFEITSQPYDSCIAINVRHHSNMRN